MCKKKKTYRIFWVSEHPYLPIQEEALRQQYGEVEIICTKPRQSYADVRTIVDWFREGQFDLLISLQPDAVKRKYKEFGVEPVYPYIEDVADSDEADFVTPGGVRKRFVEFRVFEDQITKWRPLEGPLGHYKNPLSMSST